MRLSDRKHLSHLRQLPCCQCGRSPAGEVHHATGAGMGLRAHDHQAMPLCHSCHMSFHALSGPFKGWRKEQIRWWQASMVERYRPGGDGLEVGGVW